jgi:hypothetical protein
MRSTLDNSTSSVVETYIDGYVASYVLEGHASRECCQSVFQAVAKRYEIMGGERGAEGSGKRSGSDGYRTFQPIASSSSTAVALSYPCTSTTRLPCSPASLICSVNGRPFVQRSSSPRCISYLDHSSRLVGHNLYSDSLARQDSYHPVCPRVPPIPPPPLAASASATKPSAVPAKSKCP